jgi:hypothetical protein
VKLFLMSSDESGNIDPTPLHQIFKRLPLTTDLSQADAVVVPVAYFGNYKFNHNLTSLKKKIILFDFTEFGWPWHGQSDNVLGRGAFKNFPHLNTPEYAMLDKWASDFPATIHFKRELRKCDQSANMFPVSFLCDIPPEPIQSKEEFNARPIEVFYNWGYSHPSRRRLHGEIFCKADSKNIHVIDSLDHGDHFEGSRNWVTVHTPHYARKPMSHLMHWQKRAKLTVSMPGAGITCFRSAEVVGSIMALQYDPLSWAYDWFNGVNCIRLSPGKEFEELNQALERDNLHDIYVASQESIDKWRPHRFIPEYVIPKIQERL